ncbi:MAG: GntR family transcriptional regulator [Rhodovulum sp.]|nr:GntR family transcriptional regulator [Rhodovulum sp.]
MTSPPAASPANEPPSLVDVLEEEIVLGYLLPRERLVEEEVAVRFGVKRHVARDAILRLERMGLVDRTPNKGAVVRMLTAREVEQIYAVREVLETLAAAQIPLPAAPALVDRLAAVQARYAAAVDAGDPRAAFRANIAFHDVLFGSCGNPHLAEAIRLFVQKVHGVRSNTAADPAHLARSRAEHEAMITALRDGDRARLVQLCRDHLVPSLTAYVAGLKRRGLA